MHKINNLHGGGAALGLGVGLHLLGVGLHLCRGGAGIHCELNTERLLKIRKILAENMESKAGGLETLEGGSAVYVAASAG